MIELRTFANQCSYCEQHGKYFIECDGKIIKEVTKKDYDEPNYILLESTFDEYLKEKWPSFQKNPFRYLGLHLLFKQNNAS